MAIDFALEDATGKNHNVHRLTKIARVNRVNRDLMDCRKEMLRFNSFQLKWI